MIFFLSVVVFFFVLQVSVYCWEKRLIWPYGALELEPRYEDPNTYGFYCVSEATQRGFLCFGWCPDMKGEKYRASYAMLVSPDRENFVIVGTGTIFGITVNSTWLYSRGQDDRLYYSTDHQNGAEIDISGTQRCQLVPGARFTQLLARHTEWLQQDRIRTQPFDSGKEIECFHRLRKARFSAMLERGLIKYTDATETWWRYSLLGAIRNSAVNYSIGMLRAVTGGRLPRSA